MAGLSAAPYFLPASINNEKFISGVSSEKFP
jgi:hypothetical protein